MCKAIKVHKLKSDHPSVKESDHNSARDAVLLSNYLYSFFGFVLGLWGKARPACCGLASL